MTIYCIDNKNLGILPVNTMKEARSMGNGFCVAKTARDIEKDTNLTMASMVKLYNSFNYTTNVKKFSDRKAASRRLFDAIEQGYSQTEAAKAKAEKRPKTSRPRDEGNGPRDIPLKINTNNEMPFRENSQSGKTWATIKEHPGKTFNEYLGLGGRANTISFAIRQGWLKKAPRAGQNG